LALYTAAKIIGHVNGTSKEHLAKFWEISVAAGFNLRLHRRDACATMPYESQMKIFYPKETFAKGSKVKYCPFCHPEPQAKVLLITANG
jgi:hypothetical protein